MGSNPVNLVLRFLLEMAALIAMGFWGWKQGAGAIRYVLALGIPLIAAALWGIFGVPDDPSRSARAVVAVPGMVRLALELAYFGFAVWALHSAGATRAASIFGLVVVVHYILSYDRVVWLVRQ
jgi:hypothetical protein